MQDYDNREFLCHVYLWQGTLHLGEFRATSAVLCEGKLFMEPMRVQVSPYLFQREITVRGNVDCMLKKK